MEQELLSRTRSQDDQQTEMLPISFEDERNNTVYEDADSFSAFPYLQEESSKNLDEKAETTQLTFLEVLRLLLEKDRELTGKLTEMIEQIEKHRKNVLIAKTTGVSVAGVGTGVLIGCVIAAPFTLGLSLLPATIFGGTCAVSGALTSAGSDIADAVITKKFESVLKILQDERNERAEAVGRFATNINGVAHKLVAWGYSKEVAVEAVFRCLRNKNVNLWSDANEEEEAVILSEAKNIVGNEQNLNATNKDCTLNSEANFKLAGGIVGASAGVGRIVMSVTPLDKVVNVFFKTGSLIGQGVLQTVGVAFGVAFTIIDIVGLVRNWKNDHPLVPHLRLIVEALKSSEEEWISMVQLLEDYDISHPPVILDYHSTQVFSLD